MTTISFPLPAALLLTKKKTHFFKWQENCFSAMYFSVNLKNYWHQQCWTSWERKIRLHRLPEDLKGSLAQKRHNIFFIVTDNCTIPSAMKASLSRAFSKVSLGLYTLCWVLFWCGLVSRYFNKTGRIVLFSHLQCWESLFNKSPAFEVLSHRWTSTFWNLLICARPDDGFHMLKQNLFTGTLLKLLFIHWSISWEIKGFFWFTECIWTLS